MVAALAACASNPYWRGSMAVQTVDKRGWRGFFDWLSQGLLGARAEIEVASLDVGDQIEAEWLPLLGITYDDKDDVLEVALEGVDHLIYGPREVWADLNVGEMISFEVIDDRGVSQIIKLRQPVMLPWPSPAMARDSAAGRDRAGPESGTTRRSTGTRT